MFASSAEVLTEHTHTQTYLHVSHLIYPEEVFAHIQSERYTLPAHQLEHNKLSLKLHTTTTTTTEEIQTHYIQRGIYQSRRRVSFSYFFFFPFFSARNKIIPNNPDTKAILHNSMRWCAQRTRSILTPTTSVEPTNITHTRTDSFTCVCVCSTNWTLLCYLYDTI